MTSNQLPFFLAYAREWWAVADALRVSGVQQADPLLAVWREAAWCHLLFVIGKHTAAIKHLRKVARVVIWILPDSAPVPSDRATAISEAADLFARMKTAVIARHPTAFSPPVAA